MGNTESFIPNFNHLHTIIMYVQEDELEFPINDNYDLQIYSGKYQCNFRKKDEYGMFTSIMNIIFLDKDCDYEVTAPVKVNIVNVVKGVADYNHPHVMDIEENIVSNKVIGAARISRSDLIVLNNFIIEKMEKIKR